MAKLIKTRRVHCPLKHINAFISEWDDGHSTIKCGLSKSCGDSCPYLKNINYKSEYKSAPEYKLKGES